MNWLLDLGNTRLKCAPLAADGGRGDVVAIAHDAIAADLPAVLGPAHEGARAWLASVAAESATADTLQQLGALGYSVERVRTAGQFEGVRIAYDDPSRLGVDRFLALLAAHRRDDGPWLLVSVGSALTVDLLDRAGRHHGGLISIVPGHQLQALASRFPVLDSSGGVAADFAGNTADALVSGAQAAALGLVEHAMRQAQRRLGVVPTVLLSGGGAASLANLSADRCIAVPSLVLDGLAIVASRGGS